VLCIEDFLTVTSSFEIKMFVTIREIANCELAKGLRKNCVLVFEIFQFQPLRLRKDSVFRSFGLVQEGCR